MLNLCLNLNQSQPINAYKCYGHKKELLVFFANANYHLDFVKMKILNFLNNSDPNSSFSFPCLINVNTIQKIIFL